jgi:glycolate oxidase iron-sulfur subunit
LPESEVCCGSAGSYNLTEPGMAQRLLERKIKNIAATGADLVVTGNPGCLLQIQAGLRMSRLPVKVIHTVDLLAQAYL